MIISTSSHNIQVTDDICDYVADTMNEVFGRLAADVRSINTQLEATRNSGSRLDIKAIVRVDLCDHQTLVSVIHDDNLYAAIRRGAADSALASDRLLRRTEDVVSTARTGDPTRSNTSPPPTLGVNYAT